MKRIMDDSWLYYIVYGIICNNIRFYLLLVKKIIISFQYNKLINNINGKHTQNFIVRIFDLAKKEIETDKYVAPIIAFLEHFTGCSK